jgi:hypothetical protein
MYTHSPTSAQIVLDWIFRLVPWACLLAPRIQHANSCAKMSPSVLLGFTNRIHYVCFCSIFFSRYDTLSTFLLLLRYWGHNIINDRIIFKQNKVKLEDTDSKQLWTTRLALSLFWHHRLYLYPTMGKSLHFFFFWNRTLVVRTHCSYCVSFEGHIQEILQ